MRHPMQSRRLDPYVHPSALVSFRNLRRACAAAGVPLEFPDGWAASDEEVVMAVEAARDGHDLPTGAAHLQEAVDAGRLWLGSRVGIGLMTAGELLVLASILRSPVAHTAVTA